MVEGVTSAAVSQKDKHKEVVNEVVIEHVNDVDSNRQHSESVQTSCDGLLSSSGSPGVKQPSFIELGDLVSSSGLQQQQQQQQQQQHSIQSTATHPTDNHTTDERLHVYDFDDDSDFAGSEDGVGKRSADADENERQLTGAARVKQKRRRLLDDGVAGDDGQYNNHIRTTQDGDCNSSPSSSLSNRRLQRTPKQRIVARRNITVTGQRAVTATAPAAAAVVVDGDVAVAVNGEAGKTADVAGCERVVGDNKTSAAASPCHEPVPDAAVTDPCNNNNYNNNNNNNNNKVQELSSSACCAFDSLRLSTTAFHNDAAHSQFSLSSHFRRGELW